MLMANRHIATLDYFRGAYSTDAEHQPQHRGTTGLRSEIEDETAAPRLLASFEPDCVRVTTTSEVVVGIPIRASATFAFALDEG